MKRPASTSGVAAAPTGDFRQDLGRQGEHLACNHLKSQGYKIFATNVRTPFGEIDLIMVRDHETHFIEVKTTATPDEDPLDHITPYQQKRFFRAVQYVLQRERALRGTVPHCSVVGVDLNGATPTIEWVPDAMECEDDILL